MKSSPTAAALSHQPATWGSPFRGDQSRAKAIPRCEISIAAQPTEIRTNGSLEAIDGECATAGNVVHGARFVQPYRPTILEQRILNLLKQDECIPVTIVAEQANLSIATTRDKLEKLSAKRLVEGVPRRGYRLRGEK